MSNHEAEKIYFSIFKKKIPPFLEKQFLLAAKKIESKFSTDEINTHFKLMYKFSDLAAIEFYSRCRKINPLLSEKFKILISMAETEPDNYNLFHNQKDQLIKGYLSLMSVPFYSVYKFLKGFLLLTLFPIK